VGCFRYGTIRNPLTRRGSITPAEHKRIHGDSGDNEDEIQ